MSSITASYKIFSEANEFLIESGERPAFNIQLVGSSKEIVYNDGLFCVRPSASFIDVKSTNLIIIPAIDKSFTVSLNQNKCFVPWIVDQYKKGAEVASICTGAFLLASTGLLKGKNCSTHWMVNDEFRKMYPDVHLVTEKIITDEHGIYTNGGAFSFLHLVLYLIEKYCGREIAIYCSKVFQIDIDRNSQSPFTMFSGLKDHQDQEIKKAQLFIEGNVSEKISVENLAAKYAIDRRNFDRRFIKATTITPAEYLQRVKIEAAKKKLETSRESVNEIMYGVGYTDIGAFRKVFRNITGLSPLDYRNKYNKEAALMV